MSGITIIKGLEALNRTYPNLVLTIGNFDGVHIGHQRILRRVVEKAREIGGTSMAMSFEPHPVKVLAPDRAPKLLTSTEEKARIMGHLGIQKLLLVNFTKDFAHLEPDDFIEDILMKHLRPVHVIVGHNYAFGRGKRGDTALLRRRGRRHGFRLTVVRHAKAFGKVVSSSRTRTVIENGKMEKASVLLGRPYVIEGKVVKGAGRGASLLGYPTANIDTQHELVPKDGVYAVKVHVGKKFYDGVANIGTNPTFGSAIRACEVHILKFRENILGEKLRMHFVSRLRGEEAFATPEALREAIANDIKMAERIFRRRKIRVW
jgi:riboflavin kinase/FMN adenylyltransferase